MAVSSSALGIFSYLYYLTPSAVSGTQQVMAMCLLHWLFVLILVSFCLVL